MSYTNLLFEQKDAIAYITINRPDKLNALNKQTKLEIQQTFAAIRDDHFQSTVRIAGSL